VPTEIVVAVHNDVRISPDQVHAVALRSTQDLATYILNLPASLKRPGLGMSIRFVRLSTYLGEVLRGTLGPGSLLTRARMELVERVGPMSLHLAVARIGAFGLSMLDVLYDTTDSKPNLSAFAHVVFDPEMGWLLEKIHEDESPFGVAVRAYT
jgi:hypothetical protein